MRIDNLISKRKPQQKDELFLRIGPDKVRRFESPGHLTNKEFKQYQQDTRVRITTINGMPGDPVDAPVPGFLKKGFKGYGNDN